MLVFSLESHAELDVNSNAMSDIWERQYFGGQVFPDIVGYGPQDDPDGDTRSNADEARTGTDPFKGDSPDGFLAPELTHEQSSGVFIISWPSKAGKVYQLEACSDLLPGTWMPIGPPRLGDGLPFTDILQNETSNSSVPPHFFYRIAVGDIDTDLDDLTNFEEGVLGFNPQSSDSNDDGIPDIEELDHDNDGVPDFIDPDYRPAGNGQDSLRIKWARTPGFQFAAFNLNLSSGNILDLSDNGTVLVGEGNSYTVVDRNRVPHTYARGIHGFFDAGYFGSITEALIDDSVFGMSMEYQGQEYDLWDPVTDTKVPFSSLGYDDLIVDGRSGIHIETNRTEQNEAQTIAGTQVLPLAGSQASDGFRIETNKNIISSNGYWIYDAQASSHGQRIALPEPASGNSARLVRRRKGSNTLENWTLVAGQNGLTFSNEAGPFVQTTVTCPEGEHSLGVARQGWLATRKQIWSFEKWRPLKRHLDSMVLNDAEMRCILDTGLAVAELTAPNEQPAQPDLVSKCLLMPIMVEAKPLVLTEDDDEESTPFDPERLARGVDSISMLAIGGDAKTKQIWVMAPIGGSVTDVCFHTAATGQNTITLTGGPQVAFTPDTLSAGETDVQITGIGTTTMDVSIPITITGNRAATNQPLHAKAMKKRTVKVALHEVHGVDEHNLETEPFFMPDAEKLEIFLNKVFGPQVNVNFEVVPFVEDGPQGNGLDFDLGVNDLKLRLDSPQEVTAATQNAKTGVAGSDFNIDVWVIGGGVALEKPVGIMYERLFGYAFPSGSRIIVDGDMNGPDEIPDGSQTHHLYFTIAHEIGHIMTSDVKHPGEALYQSALNWDGRHDPYLKNRLMCPGEHINHAEPEVCLIKGEWDRIEAWLHSTIDPPEQ